MVLQWFCLGVIQKGVNEQTVFCSGFALDPTKKHWFYNGFHTSETKRRFPLGAVFMARDSAGLRRKAKLLQRAILVSLFTVLPPDRVGVIRQLRYDVTLVQDDDLAWLIDLREHRDIHKKRWVALPL